MSHEPYGSGAHGGGPQGSGPHGTAPFPSEAEWLDLPLPAPFAADEAAADAFATRVLDELHSEQRLDRDLTRLAEALPERLLATFTAPEPDADFVADTVRRVADDRRHRWQQLLARHITPEPTPEFVARTLAALREDEVATAHRRRFRLHRAATADPATAPRHRRTALMMAAMAAALLLWLMSQRPAASEPLLARLAEHAPTAAAYRVATTPLAAIRARLVRTREPFAVFDYPVDGLWLTGDDAQHAEVR